MLLTVATIAGYLLICVWLTAPNKPSSTANPKDKGTVSTTPWIFWVIMMANGFQVLMTTKRVLVIDDEPDVRAVVSACFEDIAGWHVTTADSGHAGLEKVNANPPDAIVVDMMMPGMDGLAFLRALRAQPKGAAIPVVLLTAKVNLNQATIEQELDVKGIISKPFDALLLSEQVATFLGWSTDTEMISG